MDADSLPTVDLANLAYDLYEEGLTQLRAVHHVSLEVVETVEQAAMSAGGLEAKALSYALCDYKAGVRVRTREEFCRAVMTAGG